MNKIICTVIVSSVILSAFAGCGNNDEQPNNTASADITSAATADSPVSESVSEAVSDNSEKTDRKVLYVTGAELVPFSAEGSENYQATAQLTPGTEVEQEQTDLSTEYVCVYYPQDKVKGYIQSIYLVTNKSAVANGEKLTVSSDSADLYSEEGGKGSVLKNLVQGEEVSVLAKTSGGYWKVMTADNSVGYVNLENVTDYNNNDVDNTAVNSKKGVNSNSSLVSSGTSNSQTGVYVTQNTLVGGDSGTTETYGGGTADSMTASGSANSTSMGISGNIQSETQTESSTTEFGGSADFNTAVSNARNSVGGNWAAALVELDSGSQQSYNDSQMQAASLIKLYIMGAIYERYDTYVEQDSNIDTYLYNMITISDNTAANNLVRVLGSGNTDAGKNVVTSYCQTHGYSSSSMGRLLLESTINGDNYTSVGDCARFLTAVYNRSLPHSDEMLSLLKQQTRTSKIPAGVPYGVQTANKTGELDLVQNDAAIVFADKPYVLCVMSENVSAGSAVSAIVTLSSDVYEIVNN